MRSSESWNNYARITNDYYHIFCVEHAAYTEGDHESTLLTAAGHMYRDAEGLHGIDNSGNRVLPSTPDDPREKDIEAYVSMTQDLPPCIWIRSPDSMHKGWITDDKFRINDIKATIQAFRGFLGRVSV